MTALANDEMDPIGGLPSSEFFTMLRDHTIEGMFSDPVYRGNRDLVGWKLIGYPGAQRAYTPLDMQDEGYFTKREPQSIERLHPCSPGKPGHPNVSLPVTGSGTPGAEPPDIHPQP
jgi:gluconate 2-dehydrogenase gamma chain